MKDLTTMALRFPVWKPFMDKLFLIPKTEKGLKIYISFPHLKKKKMFKKILIAEDHESSSISVQKTLEDLNISNADYVYYCDDALAKIQKSIRETIIMTY
jgi:hypothetical protein